MLSFVLTTATAPIAFGRRCRNHSACSPGGDSSGTSDWLILLFLCRTSKHCFDSLAGAGRYEAGSHPEHGEWWNVLHFISDSWSWAQNVEEKAIDTTRRQHQDTAHVGREGNGFQPTLSVHMLAVKQEHKLLHGKQIKMQQQAARATFFWRHNQKTLSLSLAVLLLEPAHVFIALLKQISNRVFLQR